MRGGRSPFWEWRRGDRAAPPKVIELLVKFCKLRELHKKDDPIAMGIEGKFQRTIFGDEEDD